MLRTPPHILVTTPESLYLLLTAERSRQMLRTVRTVIVDEIHAVIGTRRGAHLALSLERLQQVAERPLLRIGLSATQKPIDEVARFLVGADPARGDCAIVDEGHRRAIDLALELPRSPLEAVMSHEIWEEYYDRLARLVGAHRTTLVFVNTRRLAERLARHLSERLGEDAVTAHHGSLSKETPARRRDRAEDRRAARRWSPRRRSSSASTSATSISSARSDRRIGSPRCCSASAARATRSRGTPKGRLFPMSRDDLVECAALLRSVRRGELDRIVAARRAARRAGAADRRRDRVRRTTARTSCSRWCAGRGRIARCARRVRRGRRDAGRRLRDAARPPRARSSTATKCTGACAAGAARGCWR